MKQGFYKQPIENLHDGIYYVNADNEIIFRNNSAETHTVTVSIGGTTAAHDDTGESVIGRADELMYQSKRNDRNLVTIKPPD